MLPRVTAPIKKVIFMGSPAFAVPTLEKIHEQFEIVAVYSQPPRPAGRGQNLQKTAVHERAEQLGLAVKNPKRLQGDALAELLALEVEALVVVAYGLLLPKTLVEQRVCLNIHPSALPQWRGAAPVQWTLLSGQNRTDVCLMQLDAGMDTGPVLLRQPLVLSDEISTGELLAQAAAIGGELVVHGLRQLHVLEPVAQLGVASHARKLEAADRIIDWGASAREVHNRIRALSPLPGATFGFADERVKVLASRMMDIGVRNQESLKPAGTVVALGGDGIAVVCGDGGVVRLLTVQRPGKRAMPVREALPGWGVEVGVTFS